MSSYAVAESFVKFRDKVVEDLGTFVQVPRSPRKAKKKPSIMRLIRIALANIDEVVIRVALSGAIGFVFRASYSHSYCIRTMPSQQTGLAPREPSPKQSPALPKQPEGRKRAAHVHGHFSAVSEDIRASYCLICSFKLALWKL